jgi:hypothetical protein
MSYLPVTHTGTNLAPAGVTNEGISPHPVLLPMGEGTPEQGSEHATPSPLPWGEGQGEGREFRSRQNRATARSYASVNEDRLFSSRTPAP